MMSVPKKKGKGLLLLLAVAIAIAVIVPNTKSHKYKKAQELLWDGQYTQAAELFLELDDYERSEELLLKCRYGRAAQLLSYRNYEEALYAFEALGDYEDVSQRIQECYFGMGREALEAGEYEQAISHFMLAENNPDTQAKLDETYYAYGHKLFLAGEYDQAQTQFDQILNLPTNAKPHFVTLEDARTYLQEQSDLLAETIFCYVGQIPEMSEDLSLFDVVGNYVPYQSGSAIYNQAEKSLRITATYYPGKRILYAWRAGDTSMLTEDERKAMEVAMDLVEKARKKSDKPMDIELYLYNWLCNHVVYESPDMHVDTGTYLQLRQLNCLGALLDGKANCQGYTDAFYLLGSMAGFDVRRISGTGYEEGHSWNGILLEGKYYIVDVTFGDADELGSTGKTYTWFNCAYDPEIYAVDGGVEIIPELVTENDLSQSYYKYKKSLFSKLGDASYYLLRQYKKNGKGWTFAVVTNKEVTKKQLETSISNNRSKAGVRSYQYTYLLEYYQGNTYIAVKWK